MALAKFAVMTLTEAAAERVREIVGNAEDAVGIRLGIKNGGCAGAGVWFCASIRLHPATSAAHTQGSHTRQPDSCSLRALPAKR